MKKTVGILSLSTKKLRRKIESKYGVEEFDLREMLLDDYLKRYAGYISKTYQNWLKNINLRILPIDVNADIEDIYKELDNINGLLLTGGGVDIYHKNHKKSKYLL